jgi:hypothetical protein
MFGDHIDLGNPVSDHPLNRSLASWWLPLPGRAGGSRLFDIKGGKHGTLTNGPTWVSGGSGLAALSLDGTDDHADCALSSTATDNFSYFAVATPRTLPTLGMFMENGANNGLAFGIGQTTDTLDTPGSSFNVLFGGVAWFQPGYTFTVSRTVLAGVVRRAGTLYCYVDGQQVGSTTGSGPGTPTTRTSLGRRSGAGGDQRYFAGRLDSAWVYNRALAADEVWRHYEDWRLGYAATLRRFSRRAYLFAPAAPPASGNRRRRVILCGGS